MFVLLQHVILVLGTIGIFLFVVALTALFAAGGDSTDTLILLGLFAFQVFDVVIAACTARFVYLLYLCACGPCVSGDVPWPLTRSRSNARSREAWPVGPGWWRRRPVGAPPLN